MQIGYVIAGLFAASLALAELRVEPGEDLARACDQAMSQPDKTVRLSSGTHFLPATLALHERHSGLKLIGDDGAILSGGLPLTHWQQSSPGVWECRPGRLPADRRTLRILRLGDQPATLARHPNFDAASPITGGWLFAEARRTGKGKFGEIVGKIHTAGDTLEWDVVAASAGRYRVFFRYAAYNEPFGTRTMAGRTQLQANDGEPIVLYGLDDTGDWGKHEWSEVGELHLRAGRNRLRWTNLQGGGLNFDAMALSRDEAWKPEGEPAATDSVLIVQAESVVNAKTKEGYFPEFAESGEPLELPFKAGDLRAYPDLANLEIHMFPAWGWVNAIVYPTAIDHETRVVTLQKTESASQPVWAGNRYFIANSRSDMDQLGEWCIDRQDGIIALRSDTRPAGAVLPVLKTLIAIAGAHDISMRNLTFRDTACSSDFGPYSPDDAAIVIQQGADILIQQNRFLDIGGYALALRNQTRGTQFLQNEVAGAGQGGVILEGDRRSQSLDTLIAANWIHDCGRIYKHVAGVYGVTASRTHVAHNRIERMPRYAISFKSFGDDAFSSENTIEYNELLQTNLETNDTGAIETLGRHHRDMNNTIRFNLIRDVVGLKTMSDGQITSPFMTWGIYLDDYSSGTTVYGNIVENTNWGAVCIHAGANNTIENNIFIEGAEHQLRFQPRDERFTNNRVLRNIFFNRNPNAGLFYTSARFPAGARLQSDFNLFWHASGPQYFSAERLTPEGTLAQWQAAGYDGHSLVADPMLTNAQAGDYTLKPDSPALGLGFIPIPIDRIGIKGWKEQGRD